VYKKARIDTRTISYPNIATGQAESSCRPFFFCTWFMCWAVNIALLYQRLLSEISCIQCIFICTPYPAFIYDKCKTVWMWGLPDPYNDSEHNLRCRPYITDITLPSEITESASYVCPTSEMESFTIFKMGRDQEG